MTTARYLAIPHSAALLARALSFLLLGVAVLMLTFAPARAADRDRLRAFLQITGFDVALDSIRMSAADGPAMLGLEASDFGLSWTLMADEVFAVDKMRGMAMDILEDTLEDDVLAHAADFYATDLGQRLVEAENAAHMTEGDAKREEGGLIVTELEEAGDEERLAALRRLNAAVDSSDSAIRAMQEIEIRFLLAAEAAGVIELRVDEQTLREAQKEQTERLKDMAQLSALAASASTYRDFTTEELNDYAEALEHPMMQKVYELMNAVQWEVMANRFEAMAARMAGLQPGREL